MMSNREVIGGNSNILPLTKIIGKLWAHTSGRRRWQLGMLFLLSLLSSFFEVVSLGAVVPFIGVVTNPSQVLEHSEWSKIATLMEWGPDQITVGLTILFGLTSLLAGAIRLVLLWVTIRLGNSIGADISVDIYRRTLYQPYKVHVARNTSEVVSGITQKVGVATSVLISLVTVLTMSMLFITIIGALVYSEPVITFCAIFGFGGSYGVFAWRSKRRLLINGDLVASNQTSIVKALQEGLGSIRDVLLGGTQHLYCHNYQISVQSLQKALSENAFINQSPRYLMESLGLVLISVLVLVLNYSSNNIVSMLPILGMLALGAQRLLPIMQQLYGNWSVLYSSRASLIEVINLLEQPMPCQDVNDNTSAVEFKKSVEFRNLFFNYEDELGRQMPHVFNGVSIKISKGDRVGLVGTTGSGKSTFLDLLICLLDPTNGSVVVDGVPLRDELVRPWQKLIAYVPQSIFLTDNTIAANIAFDVTEDEIDMEKVRDAARRAGIADHIEGLRLQYQTMVGERGVRLSGGQRQRIGIARAFYKKAALLILDEATSALDSETEEYVMDTINNLDRELTVLMVAHRHTTLKYCDYILKVEQGAISNPMSYQQLQEIETRGDRE
jgi:ATP-binding cassette, subfamily B, bacterial PglK